MKFIEILQQYNIPTAPEGHHHQTEGWIQFDCPFCGKNSRRYHMGYNVRGGFVNCWKCGGHSLVSVLQEYTELHYRKIKTIINQIDDIIKQPVKRENKEGFLKLPSIVGDLKEPHIRYLNSRGFNHNEIQKLWQVKGIGVAAAMSWRLFIPIIHRGKMVSWTSRAINPRLERRYISANIDTELIPHKNILYGGDYVRSSVIVTEGPLDVWRIGPGAVATFGTSFTKQQVLQLINVPRRYICYDNEPEAQKSANKLCKSLSSFDGETVNIVLDSKDAGSAKPSEIKKLKILLK